MLRTWRMGAKWFFPQTLCKGRFSFAKSTEGFPHCRPCTLLTMPSIFPREVPLSPEAVASAEGEGFSPAHHSVAAGYLKLFL